MTPKSNDPICEFYTNHPYPPPIENLERARELYRDENIPRAEFHLLWPNKEYRADLDVLVAGCGTWQSAKYALCHPGARVVAVDVSTTSLEHTERHKQNYNLTNLTTKQVAIENVNELDKRFDHIICTGVLHHLADPDAGLRALRSVLKPDGAMYLMVYAPGLTSRDEIATLVSSVDRPVNVLMGIKGVQLTLADLSAMGVKRISVGSTLARCAFGALLRAANEMKDQGTFGFIEDAADSRMINSIFASR